MKVTVFSTKGKKKSVVDAGDVTTWGELKSTLNSEGIETTNMKAIIGENQVTLESTKAILPADFNFTLFLTPIKVKNGNVIDIDGMNYKECRAFIKDNGGSDKFGNYTHMSTDTMKTVIKGFLAVSYSEEITEEVDTIALVDNCIESLNELKAALISGVSGEVEGDLVESLNAWFKEIESNL